MIAGRLRWRDKGATIPGKVGLAAFDFPTGTLLFTEAGLEAASVDSPPPRRRRARASSSAADSKCSRRTLAGVRRSDSAENHTLKRALTDPTIFSGIGNAYSDEILHAARLSPMKQHGSSTTRRSRRCSRRRSGRSRLDRAYAGRGR